MQFCPPTFEFPYTIPCMRNEYQWRSYTCHSYILCLARNDMNVDQLLP